MTAPSLPVYSQPDVEIGPSRVIQDKGIYVLSEQELTAWRLRILVDVLVAPNAIYKSLKPNEPENYFGVFQLVEGGFVIEQHNLKYTHQQVYRYQNDPAKSLFDVTYGLRTTIYDLYQGFGAVLASIPGSAVLTVVDGTEDPDAGRHLSTPITEIWFRTANGAKIVVHSEWLPLPQINGQPASVPEPKADNSPSAPSGTGGDGSAPSDTPSATPPTAPYDPTTNDNKRTTPPPVAPVAHGQWYGLYSGLGSDGHPYSGREYALPGATDNPPAPILSNVRQGTRDGYQRAEVIYKGGVVDNPTDYSSYTFEWRPGG